MEKETPFITPKDPTTSLFQDLGTELDFGDANAIKSVSEDTSSHPLSLAKTGTGLLLALLLVYTVVASIDVSMRNMETTGFFKELPLCGYYTLGTDNYKNQSCGSYVEAKNSIDVERTKLESDLGTNLALMVPNKTAIQNPTAQPEVQYILQKTASRSSLRDAITSFNRIKNTATDYQGKDIDCSKFTLNEKGGMTVSCDFYGFALLSSDEVPNTSRTTALALLDKLSDPNSGFTLVEQPRNLEIEKYTSTDTGLRSTFSTRTSLILRLKYSPLNKL